MTTTFPNTVLREALEQIGVRETNQQRNALRALVHLFTGEPPAIGTSVEKLAKTLLRIRDETRCLDMRPKRMANRLRPAHSAGAAIKGLRGNEPGILRLART